jgi:cytochrome c-type biogenesis protein CcmH
MKLRQRRWAWAGLIVVVAVLLGIGARPRPTSGQSEDRVYAIAGQMKCLQCVGESVANSQAQIAVQMRTEIRNQMRAGRHDDEILSYFADRYGQRVLLKPPASGLGALVWIVPVVAFGAAVTLLATSFARSRSARADSARATVSEDDRALVEAAREGADAGRADPGSRDVPADG